MASSRRSYGSSNRFQKVSQYVVLFVLFCFIVGSIIVGGISSRYSKGTDLPAPNREASPESQDQDLQRWEEAVKLNPKDAFAYRNLARAALRAGNGEKARKALSTAVKLSPREPMNYELLGQMALGEGKAKEAVEHYKKALRLSPKNPAVEFSLAMAYDMAGKQGEARELYEKFASKSTDPNLSGLARRALLAMALRTHNEKEIRKQAMALYQISPEEPGVLEIMAEVESKQKHTAQALAFYEKARKLDPENASLESKIARLYYEQGNHERSALEWEALVKKHPHEPDYKYGLALADKKLNKRGEARDLLERALKEAEERQDKDLKKKIEQALAGF